MALPTFSQRNKLYFIRFQTSAVMQMRSALFLDFTQRIMVVFLPTFRDKLSLPRFYRNVGRKLPFCFV